MRKKGKRGEGEGGGGISDSDASPVGECLAAKVSSLRTF